MFTPTGIYFPTSIVGFEPQGPTLPKLTTKRGVSLEFFGGWRKFYVVLRIRGRIEKLDIKKGSEDRNSRNVNHYVWMIRGHSYFPTILFTLDALKKVVLGHGRVGRQIL